MTAPFVGPPQVGTGCAYSPDLDGSQCISAATVHIAVDSSWGVVGLASCDEHASIARASGTPVGEHAYGRACDGSDCWDGTR